MTLLFCGNTGALEQHPRGGQAGHLSHWLSGNLKIELFQKPYLLFVLYFVSDLIAIIILIAFNLTMNILTLVYVA